MDNNNNTWLWILLLLGAIWLLSNNARSNQSQLLVVEGHEQFIGLSSEDGNDLGRGVRSHRPPSQAHHILNKISDTHNTVRGWFEIFENLAVGTEKLLTVVTTLRK